VCACASNGHNHIGGQRTSASVGAVGPLNHRLGPESVQRKGISVYWGGAGGRIFATTTYAGARAVRVARLAAHHHGHGHAARVVPRRWRRRRDHVLLLEQAAARLALVVAHLDARTLADGGERFVRARVQPVVALLAVRTVVRLVHHRARGQAAPAVAHRRHVAAVRRVVLVGGRVAAPRRLRRVARHRRADLVRVERAAGAVRRARQHAHRHGVQLGTPASHLVQPVLARLPHVLLRIK
jgi:hypothetical protein